MLDYTSFISMTYNVLSNYYSIGKNKRDDKTNRIRKDSFQCYLFLYCSFSNWQYRVIGNGIWKSETEFSPRKHVAKLVRVTTGRKRRFSKDDSEHLVKTCPRQRIMTSLIANLKRAHKRTHVSLPRRKRRWNVFLLQMEIARKLIHAYISVPLTF